MGEKERELSRKLIDTTLVFPLSYVSVKKFFSFFVCRKHPPQAPPVREPQGPPVPAAGAEARPRAAAGDNQEQHRAAEAQRRRRQGRRRVPPQEEDQGGLIRGRPGQAGAAAGAAAAVRGGAAAAAAGHPRGHAATAAGGRRSRHAGEGQSQEVDGPTGKAEKLQFPNFPSLFNPPFFTV